MNPSGILHAMVITNCAVPYCYQRSRRIPSIRVNIRSSTNTGWDAQFVKDMPVVQCYETSCSLDIEARVGIQNQHLMLAEEAPSVERRRSTRTSWA